MSPGPQLLRIPQCMMLITPELVESCHRTVYCCTDGTDFPFIGEGVKFRSRINQYEESSLSVMANIGKPAMVCL